LHLVFRMLILSANRKSSVDELGSIGTFKIALHFSDPTRARNDKTKRHTYWRQILRHYSNRPVPPDMRTKAGGENRGGWHTGGEASLGGAGEDVLAGR